MDAAKTERGGEVLCVNGFDYVERKDRRGRDGHGAAGSIGKTNVLQL